MLVLNSFFPAAIAESGMTPKCSTFFMLLHRWFYKHTQRCVILRYLFVIGLSAIALSINQLIEHLFDEHFLVVPILSIMLSAFFAGMGPGILSLLISALVNLSFLCSLNDFSLISYLFFGTFLTWFSSQLGSALISIDTEREKERFLMNVTTLLNSSFDAYSDSYNLNSPSVIDQFTKALVPQMADSCAIDILDKSGKFSRLSIAHFSEEWEKIAADPLNSLNSQIPQIEPSQLTSEIIHTHSWNQKQEVRPTLFNQEQLKIFSNLGIHSIMTTPLAVRKKHLGAISFFLARCDRKFSSNDLLFAQEIAWRAAISLDNSRLYSHAQKAIHVRENLMAVVAHDLKNPITSIQLNANLLTKIQVYSDKSEISHKLIERIQHATGRMNYLISDILDFGKIVAGRLVIDLAPTEIKTLIQETVELLRPIAEQKEIKIQIKTDPLHPIQCHCDRERISQTLSNLLGNAIKFTPRKGWIEVNVQIKSQELVFSVSDSGPGIDSQSLPYIFDWYWQEKSKKRGGCGLGLSIAKGITEAHHGRIWAENHLEKGCTFYFTLPLQSL